MRRCRVLMAWSCVLLIDPHALAQEEKTDRDSLQGKWSLVQLVKNGRTTDVTDKSNDYFALTFKGDKITARFKIGKEEGTYQIDPNKLVKTIDIHPSTGDDKGKTLRGIYELKGNQLKLCVADPGVKRPAEFRSKGDQVVVYVLRRAKS